MAERVGAQLESNKHLKSLVRSHFEELAAAEGSGAVAWCTSVGPAELLRALGFKVFFPENHGAVLGATRMAGETMHHAHALGYSPDICSYLTSDIGAFLAGTTPLAAAYGIAHVPRPSVLVYNTNQCHEVQEWFSWYGRRLGVPVFGIHSPRDLDAVTPEAIAFAAAQFRRMKEALASLAPRPFSMQALEETMALSRDASRLWGRCLETAAARPAPWTFFDHTVHMAPIVVMRGTPEAVGYYQELLAELEEHVSSGRCAVPGERHRVYWEGMPIWGQLRPLSELFAAAGTSLVASTYCNSWVLDQQDPKDPWESMAEAYLSIFICRSEAYKETYIAQTASRFGAGGVIFHDSKTCPHNSNTRFGMPRRLREATGMPVLVVEGDLNDPRCFSFEETRVRLEVFLEQMDEGPCPGAKGTP